ncbi:MAG: hypothetical protein ACM34E_01490, partial [Acidobacteriota bacterium]
MARVIEQDLRPIFFTSIRWDFGKTRSDHPHGGELHSHVLSLGLSNLLIHDGLQRIELRYCRRQGRSEEGVARWFDSLVELRLAWMIESGGSATPFPNITVSEVEPHVPGAQVVDHLLWAEGRADPTFLQRLGIEWEFVNETPGPLTIRRYRTKGVVAQDGRARPLGREPSELSTEYVFYLFACIEYIVHAVARKKPVHVMHLEPYWAPAAKQCRGAHALNEDGVRRLCTAFLLLVDTLPVYTSSRPASIEAASDAARLASILAAGSEARALPIIECWRD